MANKNSSNAEAPLILSQSKPFGIGGRRLCFVHPLEPAKCIKVLRTDARRTIRSRASKVPAQFRRKYDNNADEQAELENVFRRVGPSAAECLPRCYGVVPTDLGPGLVLDLIRDADGGISRSIRELITKGMPLAELRPAFNAFGDFLLRHRILTRRIHDHNLAARHNADGTRSLFLIDGLGDPTWLPLSRWIRSLGEAKIRRNLAIAWTRFEKFAATGGVTEAMRKNSTWGQGILDHRGL
jgi:hypothetical protein